MSQEPVLIITFGSRPFEVAPECNGFGLLSGCMLLTLLLAIYHKFRWWVGALFIAGSICWAFMVNMLRILIIILLAPLAGDHYYTMHEIVGVSLFWLALIAVWMGAGKLHRGTKALPKKP